MIELLQGALEPLGLLTPISWLFPLLLDIPGFAGGVKAFQKFNKERVIARKKVCPDSPVCTACLSEYPDRPRVTRSVQLVDRGGRRKQRSDPQRPEMAVRRLWPHCRSRKWYHGCNSHPYVLSSSAFPKGLCQASRRARCCLSTQFWIRI